MSGNKQDKPTFLRRLLLEKSDTFCIVPWTHLHTTPTGIAAPCCIAESCATEDGVGDAKKQGLMELVNSPKMNQLRLDMLKGVKNNECNKCHKHEEQGIKSFRQMINDEMGNYFEEAIETTNLDDGSLSEFKMRYFDIRFSNICNFKCRTCGSAFSTQWEQEDLKNNVWYAKVHPKNDNKAFLNDVIEQIDHMETAYFAGGEPLITEEHYILLEEMIKRKRTNIKLRYNTNMSNLKFKDKDLLSLWKNFKSGVNIYASIDHVGERAEYIRHGTDWGVVETNFLNAKKQNFITIQINTVLSVFNYLTIFDFYKYLIDKKLYSAKDSIYTVYNMSTPEHLTCHILPPDYKERGNVSMQQAIQYMHSHGFGQDKIKQLSDTTQWVFSQHTWEAQKAKFREEVSRLDRIRSEDFTKVFPEIGNLLRPDRVKLWPV